MNEAILGEHPFFLRIARMQIGFGETGALTQRRKPKSCPGTRMYERPCGLTYAGYPSTWLQRPWREAGKTMMPTSKSFLHARIKNFRANGYHLFGGKKRYSPVTYAY
jgi:hypothetical protein